MSGIIQSLFDEDEIAAITQKDAPEHKVWLCAYQKESQQTIDGTEDFKITLREPLVLENLLPTDIGIKAR